MSIQEVQDYNQDHTHIKKRGRKFYLAVPTVARKETKKAYLIFDKFEDAIHQRDQWKTLYKRTCTRKANDKDYGVNWSIIKQIIEQNKGKTILTEKDLLEVKQILWDFTPVAPNFNVTIHLPERTKYIKVEDIPYAKFLASKLQEAGYNKKVRKEITQDKYVFKPCEEFEQDNDYIHFTGRTYMVNVPKNSPFFGTRRCFLTYEEAKALRDKCLPYYKRKSYKKSNSRTCSKQRWNTRVEKQIPVGSAEYPDAKELCEQLHFGQLLKNDDGTWVFADDGVKTFKENGVWNSLCNEVPYLIHLNLSCDTNEEVFKCSKEGKWHMKQQYEILFKYVAFCDRDSLKKVIDEEDDTEVETVFANKLNIKSDGNESKENNMVQENKEENKDMTFGYSDSIYILNLDLNTYSHLSHCTKLDVLKEIVKQNTSNVKILVQNTINGDFREVELFE